jgi:uncharacterized protein YjbJ (UPF0337 family)
MRTVRAILTAAACLALWPASGHAQSGAPAATTAPSAPAKDSLRKVAWDKVAGNWKRLKGSVRQRWGKLTNNEIQQAQGRRETLNGFIQSRYGIDREAADRQIDEWLKTQSIQ